MTSSYSTSLRLTKQGTGDNTNTWGSLLNSGVFDLLDTAIAGVSTVAISGNTTLSSANGTSDQSRAAVLKLTTATSTYTTTMPAVSKVQLVWNASSAAQTLASAGGGTSVSVDAGAIVLAFSDGTNVKQLGYSGYGLKDYIDQAVMTATGSLPAFLGNSGKWLYCDGTTWLPQSLSATAAQNFAGSATDVALTPGGTTSALGYVDLYINGSSQIVTGSAAGTTLNMTSFINARLQNATGALTLPNPSAIVANRGGKIRIEWTGSGTITLGSGWKRPGGDPTFTGTNGAVDYIRYDPESTSEVIYAVNLNPSA